MKTIRSAMGLALVGLGMMSGTAFADSIIHTTTFGPGTTDFNWSINVAKFTVPVGYHLTAVNLELVGSAASSPFTLTNSSASNQKFGLQFTTFININGNSASSDAVGDAISLNVFNSGGAPGNPTKNINLGKTGQGTCSPDTPTNSCSSVSYTSAAASLSSGVYSIASGDWGNYLGSGDVTLDGNTQSNTTFAGGGGNINLSQTTTATVTANIEWIYEQDVVSDTPEPATLTLMGAALVGLGFLRKRIAR